MTEKRWVKNKLYKLIPSFCKLYDQADDGKGNACIGYHYAKPIYTGDYNLCECWIVNKEGKVHPFFKNSPVPVNRDSIE